MSETSRQAAAATGAGAPVVPPGVEVSRKVAEVAECDARGDHERAVRLLADWTQQGDVDAMTESANVYSSASKRPSNLAKAPSS